jgi:hypothetical protein
MILLFFSHVNSFGKFYKMLFKRREYRINVNPEKCAFMVYSRTILGFIVSKKGKTCHPKKMDALVKIIVPKTP